MPGRSRDEDPIKLWRFRLRCDGFVRATASEITGVGEFETEVVSYSEGGVSDTDQKSPGRTTFPSLVVKRGQIVGVPGEDDLFNKAINVYRHNQLGNAEDFRFTFTIEQLGNGGDVVRTWTYDNCWVSAFKGAGDLNATSSENSYEQITIVNEGFRKSNS